MKGSFIVYSTNYVRKQKQDMKKTWQFDNK